MGYCLTTVKMQPGFNQTLIKTSTGIWSVTYNAENRPVRWECGNTVITMDFDRMGRRVFYKEEVADVVTKHHKFVYDNYLCVQKLDALNNNSQINLFVWDPTESVATRPLFMVANPGNYKLFYTFDGNKNVSELVHFESRNGIAAHYDYAPFGAVTRAVNTSAISARNFSAENPFRFSSEYHDDTLGLVYYNYRHYNPADGRWCGRDFIEDILLEYSFLMNNPTQYDALGLVLGSPLSMTNSIIFRPNRPKPSPPSMAETFIPVYGPLRGMDYAFYNGNYIQGAVYMGMAIADLALIKSVVVGLGKGCWKTGSHTWTATRRWYGKHNPLPKNTDVHHQIISRNGPFGKKIPDWIKNQPWNLNPIYGRVIDGKQLTSSQIHHVIHGAKNGIRLTRLECWTIQYSDGIKFFQIDTVLHLTSLVFFIKIGESKDVYLDGERLE